MKSTYTILFLMVSPFLSSNLFAGKADQPDEQVNQSSILFMENKGQVLNRAGLPADDVLFIINQQSLTTFIHRNGISYQFEISEVDEANRKSIPGLSLEEEEAVQPVINKTFRTQMTLLGANMNAQVIADKQTPFYENYYNPSFPDGLTGVRSFQQITIKNIYPGIDWVIYAEGKNLKYDFIVHAGADVSLIKMKYEAADQISLINDSNLSIQTKLGAIEDTKLYSYILETGAAINSTFELNDNIISFGIDHFNHEQTLVIDPEVIWSTNYGGDNEDAVNGMDMGPDGYFYGVGYTGSTAGIGYLGFDSTFNGGSLDIHVVKFDTLGNKLWGTYLGGSETELGSNIHATDDGLLYISGYSQSWNFPTTFGVYQPFWGGFFDAVVIKMDTDGNRIWATYAGGWYSEFGRGIKADENGDVYLAGSSYSNGLGFMGHQNFYQGFGDQILFKFNSSGDRIWSTYYGGDKEDVSRDVVVDQEGNVIIVGYSESTYGIALNGMDSVLADKHDCTLAKFSTDGTLIWGTYFGGNKDDNGNDVDVDAEGNIYIATQMSSSGLAYLGYDMSYGGTVDAMLAKFSPDGDLTWSTYLGGVEEDEGKIVRVIGDAVYMTGYAYSTSDVAVSGFQSTNAGEADGFIARFDQIGNLNWCSYQGGTGVDYCRGVDGYNDYSVYTCGKTFSSDFPTTPGAFHETYQGGIADGFIRKILLCADLETYYLDADGDGYGNDAITIESCNGIPIGYAAMGGDCNDANATIHPDADEICNGFDENCDLIIDNDAIVSVISASGALEFCKGYSVTLSANEGIGNTYQWKRNGSNIGGATGKDHIAAKTGDYSVRVTVPGGCNDISEITTVIVYAKPNPVITPIGSLDICIEGFVKLKTPNALGHTFQWYKDEVSITGATNNSYNATAIGSYVVKQMTDHGCVKFSFPAHVTTSCKFGENSESESLIIYPNPVFDHLIINLQTASEMSEVVIINIYNEIGEIIQQINAEMNYGILTEEIILPATISNGIYLVQAVTSAQVFTQQIVVAK